MSWRQWIEPRSTNERVAQQERAINVLAFWGMVAGLAYFLIVAILSVTRQEAQWPSFFGSLLCAGMSFTAYRLSRSGRIRAGILLVVTAAAFIGLYSVYVRGGLTFSVIALAPAAVFAGTTLGGRAGVMTAAIELVLYAIITIAQERGIITPSISANQVTGIALTIVSLGLLTLITWQTMHSIEALLKQAKEREAALQSVTAELKTALADEQEQGEYMQTLVHNEQNQQRNLLDLIQQLQGVASNLASAATEILAAVSQQASGASEQLAAISQTSSTIDQVRAIAEQTAQRAQSVADTAQRTATVSSSGQRAVVDAVAGMEQVKVRVESIASNILALAEQTQAIAKIIATVEKIAAQSHMLALNAAVEASRAGEAGRGFAVVASEIRRLAEQSKEATAQVREILSEIQQGVNTAVMTTEEGMKQADVGTLLARKAGDAIQKLADDIVDSTQAAIQIAAAAGQQLTGMEQIVQGMSHIQQASTQSVSGAELVEQTATELHELASKLQNMVERYPRS